VPYEVSYTRFYKKLYGIGKPQEVIAAVRVFSSGIQTVTNILEKLSGIDRPTRSIFTFTPGMWVRRTLWEVCSIKFFTRAYTLPAILIYNVNQWLWQTLSLNQLSLLS